MIMLEELDRVCNNLVRGPELVTVVLYFWASDTLYHNDDLDLSPLEMRYDSFLSLTIQYGLDKYVSKKLSSDPRE